MGEIKVHANSSNLKKFHVIFLFKFSSSNEFIKKNIGFISLNKYISLSIFIISYFMHITFHCYFQKHVTIKITKSCKIVQKSRSLFRVYLLYLMI